MASSTGASRSSAWPTAQPNAGGARGCAVGKDTRTWRHPSSTSGGSACPSPSRFSASASPIALTRPLVWLRTGISHRGRPCIVPGCRPSHEISPPGLARGVVLETSVHTPQGVHPHVVVGPAVLATCSVDTCRVSTLCVHTPTGIHTSRLPIWLSAGANCRLPLGGTRRTRRNSIGLEPVPLSRMCTRPRRAHPGWVVYARHILVLCAHPAQNALWLRTPSRERGFSRR